MEHHPKKKMMETASLRVAHDAKFPSFFFFFWVIAPSSNKTNKFIPYNLIISKHKYYVIKRHTCIFHDFFYAIFCGA